MCEMMAGDNLFAHSLPAGRQVGLRAPRFLPLYYLIYLRRNIGKKNRSKAISCHLKERIGQKI